jgi:hypothetical protein
MPSVFQNNWAPQAMPMTNFSLPNNFQNFNLQGMGGGQQQQYPPMQQQQYPPMQQQPMMTQQPMQQGVMDSSNMGMAQGQQMQYMGQNNYPPQ